MSSVTFLIIGVVLFWSGFVSSISFMEAWLKFRAKGMTLPVGLSIGKKIFTALNRVEWMLMIFYLIVWLFFTPQAFRNIAVLSSLVLAILILQTVYLLPHLNRRADLIMEGKTPEKSKVHFYYVFLEFVKVGSLIALAFIYYHKVLPAF